MTKTTPSTLSLWPQFVKASRIAIQKIYPKTNRQAPLVAEVEVVLPRLLWRAPRLYPLVPYEVWCVLLARSMPHCAEERSF